MSFVFGIAAAGEELIGLAGGLVFFVHQTFDFRKDPVALRFGAGDDDEFVSAETGDEIPVHLAALAGGAENVCHFDQRLVSFHMTVDVVDGLELVQVEHDEPEIAVDLAVLDGSGRVVVQLIPVVQTGKRIV